MNRKVWIRTIITYVVLTVALIFLFDYLCPKNKVWTLIIPFVVSGLITHFIRKVFDFIYDAFSSNTTDSFLNISVKIENSSRRFLGYGASCGEVIQAGNFKADYEVEVELDITIQNESNNIIYGLNIGYTPNQYSNNYTIIDSRENKLQPLEANKNIEFRVRIEKMYHDVYAHEVDKDIRKIYKMGKDVSLLHGSEIIVNYLDSRHKKCCKKEIIK